MPNRCCSSPQAESGRESCRQTQAYSRRPPRRRRRFCAAVPSYWDPDRFHSDDDAAAATPDAAAATPNVEPEVSPRLLLAALSPAWFAVEFLGFAPDPAQFKILSQAPEYKRIALNCNRQWGKSTIAAILAVHRVLFRSDATVLIVAPSARQSGETLRKAAYFLGMLTGGGRRLPSDGVNRSSVLLPNGSRIVSLPGVEATTRGFSAVSLLIFDEASRVPDSIYKALRPVVAVSGGDILLISTPHGRRGFFYREMTDIIFGPAPEGPVEKWLKYTGPYTDCAARLPESFLNEERVRGDAHFRQEYLCEFLETGRQVFDEKTLQRCINTELKPYDWV